MTTVAIRTSSWNIEDYVRKLFMIAEEVRSLESIALDDNAPAMAFLVLDADYSYWDADYYTLETMVGTWK